VGASAFLGAFSPRHLHGIWMPLCRAFDRGQRKQAGDIYVGDDVTIRGVDASDNMEPVAPDYSHAEGAVQWGVQLGVRQL
jgi:hypothetical protein